MDLLPFYHISFTTLLEEQTYARKNGQFGHEV